MYIRTCIYNVHVHVYNTPRNNIYMCTQHINYISKLGRIHVHGKSHTVLSKDTVTSEANLGENYTQEELWRRGGGRERRHIHTTTQPLIMYFSIKSQWSYTLLQLVQVRLKVRPIQLTNGNHNSENCCYCTEHIRYTPSPECPQRPLH